MSNQDFFYSNLQLQLGCACASMGWLSQPITLTLSLTLTLTLTLCRQGKIQTRGILPILPVSSFSGEEVFFQSSTSKQLTTFCLGLGHGPRKWSRFRVFWNFQMRKNTFQDLRVSCCHMVNQVFMMEELFHLPKFEVL